MNKTLITATLFQTAILPSFAYDILHVNFNAPTNRIVQDGKSWTTAYSDLSGVTNALDTKYVEIWIAGASTNRNLVTMHSDGEVVIRGGFLGTETNILQREDGVYSALVGNNTKRLLEMTGKGLFEIERMDFIGGSMEAVTRRGGGKLSLFDVAFFRNGLPAGTIKTPLSLRKKYNTIGRKGAALLVDGSVIDAERTCVMCNIADSNRDGWNGQGVGCYGKYDNTKRSYGGIVWLTGDIGVSTFKNCLMAGNLTLWGEHEKYHGNFMCDGDEDTVVDIINCTFMNNVNCNARGCGGIFTSNTAVRVSNSAFANRSQRSSNTSYDLFDIGWRKIVKEKGRDKRHAKSTIKYSFIENDSNRRCRNVFGFNIDEPSMVVFARPCSNISMGRGVPHEKTFKHVPYSVAPQPRQLSVMNLITNMFTLTSDDWDRTNHNHNNTCCYFLDEHGVTNLLAMDYRECSVVDGDDYTSYLIDGACPDDYPDEEPNLPKGANGKRRNIGAFGGTDKAGRTPFPSCNYRGFKIALNDSGCATALVVRVANPVPASYTISATRDGKTVMSCLNRHLFLPITKTEGDFASYVIPLGYYDEICDTFVEHPVVVSKDNKLHIKITTRGFDGENWLTYVCEDRDWFPETRNPLHPWGTKTAPWDW